MEQETYEGWSNRESWAVKLHWDNTEIDQNFFMHHAKQHREKKLEAYVFADFLKAQAEDIYHEVFEGHGTEAGKLFVQDVGSLWRVNWLEIAEAYYNEVEENEL